MSLIDYQIDDRLFQSHIMSFKIPASDLKTQSLVEDGKLTFNSQPFYITDIARIRDNNVADFEVTAEIGWMKLADLKKVGNFTISGLTPAAGLSQILDGTVWTTLSVTTSSSTYSLDATDATVLDLIWQWAKVCACEISFESQTYAISMIPTIGAVRSLTFRYGRNLTQVKRTVRPPVATRLYAYGRNDITITALTTDGVPYIEDYSYYTDQGVLLADAQAMYRKDDIYSDDTFIDDVSLYNAAVARLAVLSQPTITYEGAVIDLSDIVHTTEGDYKCGDTVRVVDEELSIDAAARVTRKVTYPYSPERNQIELSFGTVLLPDPRSKSQRADSTMSWELFEDRNVATLKHVRDFPTIINRLRLDTIEGAEWVVHYKLQATGSGISNVTISATEDETATAIWPNFVDAITNGMKIEYNFSFGQKDLTPGPHTLVIRGQSDAVGKGLNIAASCAAFWVLARGTTKSNVTLPNSIRYDYTAALQSFTVPEGITEIQVECVGGSGTNPLTGGRGARVVAKFVVTPEQLYDVYVGGNPTGGGDNHLGGWPNGGEGATNSQPIKSGGGSSTHLILAGGAFAAALIVAGAGGGAGQGDVIGGVLDEGGDAGFYVATDGQDGVHGYGATQETFGLKGTGTLPGEDGDTDGIGQGGDAGASPGAFDYPGGGGGGGWHGGGGAGGVAGFGVHAGGGGAGSGYCSSAGYDLEYNDAYNAPGEDGYMIISWDAPDDTTL